MSDESPSSQLDNIIKRTQENTWETLLPDELNVVLAAFIPSHPVAFRSESYIALSAICQRLRGSSTAPSKQQLDISTGKICLLFRPAVARRISNTEEREVLEGLTFLAALFEVDWQSASLIFQEEGTIESLYDCVDLFGTSSDILCAVARLLAQASGHKPCRALISEQLLEWLTAQSRQAHDSALRASAAVALIKLSKGLGTDAAEMNSADKLASSISEDELVNMMKGLVVDGKDAASLSDAVEGLAYSSADPKIKQLLTSDSTFLSRLFSLIPRRKDATANNLGSSPIFGAVVIISNLCTYRPKLSGEEAQMAKLRRMAKTASGPSGRQEPDSDPLDDDDHVRQRGKKLIQSGVMDALTAAVRVSDSQAVRLTVARALLNLVEDKDNRGRILQAGGAKALRAIIQSVLPAKTEAKKPPSLDQPALEPIQALAKLAITASPVQVFGPNADALYDAIRPLSALLLSPAATLLQRFEALMALTNVASQGAEAASRVARAEELVSSVELLMLEDHVLVRRAATELFCNLVAGCEAVFDRYAASGQGAQANIQVLVALCDVEDVPTRLAASGALATVTVAPDACQALMELHRARGRVLPILGQLIDPTIVVPVEMEDGEEVQTIGTQGTADPGLMHRGVVCVRNLFVGIQGPAARKELAAEAEHIGIVRALVGVVKAHTASGNASLLRPTAEALRWLMENDIQIKA